MQLKIFTLRFSETGNGFDDEPVRAFMADKEVVCVKDHFFIRDNTPFWTFAILYNLKPDSAAKTQIPKEQKSKKENYRDLLDEKSMPLFNHLREWRGERSRKDGVPPYILFDNVQLAQIAAKAPDSLNGLSAIKGIGKAKLEKYGKDVLEIIRFRAANPARGWPSATSPASGGPTSTWTGWIILSKTNGAFRAISGTWMTCCSLRKPGKNSIC